MNKRHRYRLTIKWTGNHGQGTAGYRAYSRSHTVIKESKPDILCSSDPSFLGDPARHNPEELLVASVSGCHMLWYLHLCAEAGIVVTDYTDNAVGTMEETKDGGGRFTEITLFPAVRVNDAAMVEKANSLHSKANELCFIANSLNFPVRHQPVCRAGSEI